jgi:hypothetical protein
MGLPPFNPDLDWFKKSGAILVERAFGKVRPFTLSKRHRERRYEFYRYNVPEYLDPDKTYRMTMCHEGGVTYYYINGEKVKTTSPKVLFINKLPKLGR